MLEIRRSCDRLIFNIGITIRGKTVFILRRGPGFEPGHLKDPFSNRPNSGSQTDWAQIWKQIFLISNTKIPRFFSVFQSTFSTMKTPWSVRKIGSEFIHTSFRMWSERSFSTGTDFALLQQAKCVLTDPKQRADYDKWRLSGLAMGYNEWKARRESMHVVRHRI